MRRPAGVVALIGALLVVLTDFAAWQTRTSTLGTSSSPSRTGSAAQNLTFTPSASVSYESVGAFSEYAPLVLLLAGILGATAYIALRTSDASVRGRPLWQLPALAAGAAVALGAVFLVVMAAADPSDWWLDTGFFAAVIAGGASAFLLRRQPRTP